MNARLLDAPEDYKRLGVNPTVIEPWEDSRRNRDTRAGNWEWWYFDSILDDGTKAVIQFFTKAGMRRIQKDGDRPSVTVKITLPDGTLHERDLLVKAEKCSYGDAKCDVHLDKHSIVGDLKEYHIHIEQNKGLGADLRLASSAMPYRPGSGYFGFGEDEYYTWFCAVPRGEVTGNLTIGGKTISVHGSGYHDHQWGNRFYLPEWNNWLWARQSLDDYSILTFDFIASEKFDFQRFPILFIQDKDGKIVFENRADVKCTVSEFYTDEVASGKEYPKVITYEMEQDGKKITYTLECREILEAQGIKNVPLPMKWIAQKIGMEHMSYSRYFGNGRLCFENGNEVVNRSGTLIYEIMYPGKSCRELLIRRTPHFQNTLEEATSLREQ